MIDSGASRQIEKQIGWMLPISAPAADLTDESIGCLTATGLELKFTPVNIQDPGIRHDVDHAICFGIQDYCNECCEQSRSQAAADRLIRSLSRWEPSDGRSMLSANLVADVTTDCGTSNGTDIAATGEDGTGHRAHTGAGNGVPVMCRQIGTTAR